MRIARKTSHMPTTSQTNQASITKFIQAHMVMLGPRVILSLVKTVPGIQVTNTGVVNQLDQDPAALIQRLNSTFAPFGGTLTQRLHAQLFTDQKPTSSTLTSQGKL
jgi:hypothetical protein